MQFNQLSKWATLVTAHSVSGFGILEGIKNAESFSPDVGVFLIAELSSKDNLINADYKKSEIRLNHADIRVSKVDFRIFLRNC